jgi:hypothetical protein
MRRTKEGFGLNRSEANGKLMIQQGIGPRPAGRSAGKGSTSPGKDYAVAIHAAGRDYSTWMPSFLKSCSSWLGEWK